MAREGSWADVLGDGRARVFVLVCLGVWLNAADALVTATIMPSVARDLSGYLYFGWAAAGYLLGSVMATASSGLLAGKYGLRGAAASAAALYALGCAMSAAGPDILTFLAGRLLQGIGGGWVVGFCSLAVGAMFPGRTLPKVYVAINSLWGVASLLGPLIGGLFADAGAWRWTFWFFSVQGLAVAAAAYVILPGSEERATDRRIPWVQLGLIASGVAAIALADLAGDFARSSALAVLGIGLLLATAWYDERAAIRLLPRGAGDLRTIAGAGYASQFLITAASMAYLVYGPALLQSLAGLSALGAGYVVALQAVAWTVAGLIVTELPEQWRGWMIRLGAALALAGNVAAALLFPTGSVLGAAAAGILMGAGLGLFWAFMSQRILGSLPAKDRGMGAVGITMVRLTGYASGAAVAAAAANLTGVAGGMTQEIARSAGIWAFAAVIPLSAGALFAAWRQGALAQAPTEAAAR